MGVFRIENKLVLLRRSFLKEGLDQARHCPRPFATATAGTHLHRPWGLNPLGNSRGIRSWGGSWHVLALSWLILASKTPPRPSKTPRRPSKTPPRASKIPPRPPHGRPKNLDFPCVFQGFRFRGPAWSYLGPTWPPRRRQEPPERFHGPPRRLQEPPRRLHKPPKRPQEPPRCAQDTPRELPESCFSQCVSIYSTFLGLLGAILLNMAVKTPSVASKTTSRSPREPPRYPTCLQLRGQAPRVVWRWFARVGRLR